jgi:uncharacterized membrane protein YoaK (UPF0700 family)
VLVVLREAWTTLVPDMKDRHGPLPPLMLSLTVVTGLVDAFSFLALGHVFVANMTGNVVLSGFALAGAAEFSPAASLTALGAFVLGALLGGRIAHRAHADRGRLLYLALVSQTGLVLAAYVIAQACGGPFAGGPRYWLIVALALGMGVQNAAARALKVPDLMTTVLNFTITGMAADSRAAGGSGSKAGSRLLSTVAMLTGALCGALAILHGHPALPLLFAALVLAITTAATFALTRTAGSWTAPLPDRP